MIIWDLLKDDRIITQLTEERWSVLEAVVLTETFANKQFMQQLETKVREAATRGGYGQQGKQSP